jgi:glucan phosphoethanolaminetransferase (alkaline phosphatase superfamily)
MVYKVALRQVFPSPYSCTSSPHSLCVYHRRFIFFGGATARGGSPLQYASKPLDPLLCLSIRLFPSFSGPWTRHPAISFLVFLFVLMHTAFRTTYFFCDCGILHSFYMTKPSYSLEFNKPENVLSLNYGF